MIETKIPSELTYNSIRAIERGTTMEFLLAHRDHLSGRVLDYGAGSQPYKELVTGQYVPYETSKVHPAIYAERPGGQFDAVLATYVLGESLRPVNMLHDMAFFLKPGGFLIGVYQTTWAELDASLLCNLNFPGFEEAVKQVRVLSIVTHFKKHALVINDFKMTMGGAFIVRKV